LLSIPTGIILSLSVLGKALAVYPSCPNQTPCKNYGGGLFGYSINLVAADGTCREVCAAGASLTTYLTTKNFKCGKCIKPSCPAQQPCADYGNGYLAYKAYLANAADGSCSQVCAAGNTLAKYLFQAYTCGTCPPYVPPTCPGQTSCQDFGGGLLGYSVSLVAADGSCMEYCAAGSSLTDLLKTNYKCGKCPAPPPPPTCPNQVSCNDFGNGMLGYSVKKVSADGTCQEICATGTGLTDLFNLKYECGKCPPPTLPSCPNVGPCQDFGNGLLGYSVMNVVGTSCKEYCAAGSDLTALFGQGYKCGKCPLPTCSDQPTPCMDFGGGVLGYSVSQIAADGSCKEACAAGTSLTDLLSTNYKCGKCPPPPPSPTCPEAPCQDYGNGVFAYSAFLISGNSCSEWCASGAKLTELLGTTAAGGYKCGKCPATW
jgi:hypothetical protein